MKEKLKELRGKVEAKRKELKGIFAEAGSDMDMSKVESIEGDSTAKVEKVRSLNEEIDAISEEKEPLEEELAALISAEREAELLGEHREKGHPLPDRAEDTTEPKQKSLGELFVESNVGKELKGQAVELPDVDVMGALFETGAGWEPEVTRTGRLVEKAVRPIQVTDVVPTGSTGQSSVAYMEETTFTNAAVETAEGGAYAEAALALTEKSSPVRKIAVFLPMTDEQLEDVPQAQGYVNNRLPFMLLQRLDSQILVADGEAPNLTGFLNVEGILTQAKGEDTTPDAAYKAMTKVRVEGRAVPGAWIFHPNDWQQIRLLRTADGIYIWGSPSEAGEERLWGLRVIQADAITEGTALTGDFATHTELAWRRGIELKVSESHSDYFVKGKQALRADLRLALLTYRPAALATVTGI